MDSDARNSGLGSAHGSRPSAPAVARELLAARLVGRSRALRGLRRRIEGMAPLWVPVLLCGEPGSGRATAAGALHELGPTARGDWLRSDAAGFDPERKLPFLGTLYLEGIERLSRRSQLWWRERLHAVRSPATGGGIRLLASTGDLPSLRAAAPDFDPELERTLLRFAVRIAPLRERWEDLPLHAADLCARIGRAVGRERIRLSPQAQELLRHAHWPGNLRELEDVLGRALVFSTGPTIGRGLLEEVMGERGESVAAMRAQRARSERERLLAELRASGGNVTHTADALGKTRPAVYRLIEKHHIPIACQRSGAASRRARPR